MQHGLVAHRHVLADGQRHALVCVQHSIVLHIAAMAHGDRVIVAAQHGTEPHGGLFTEVYITHQRGGGGHPAAAGEGGMQGAQGVEGHGEVSVVCVRRYSCRGQG